MTKPELKLHVEALKLDHDLAHIIHEMIDKATEVDQQLLNQIAD